MIHKVNLAWKNILTYPSTKYQLKDIKQHKEIGNLPNDAKNFAERFAAYIMSCPSPIYYDGSRVSQTFTETQPCVHVGFFTYDSSKREVTFSIVYDYGIDK